MTSLRVLWGAGLAQKLSITYRCPNETSHEVAAWNLTVSQILVTDSTARLRCWQNQNNSLSLAFVPLILSASSSSTAATTQPTRNSGVLYLRRPTSQPKSSRQKFSAPGACRMRRPVSFQSPLIISRLTESVHVGHPFARHKTTKTTRVD